MKAVSSQLLAEKARNALCIDIPYHLINTIGPNLDSIPMKKSLSAAFLSGNSCAERCQSSVWLAKLELEDSLLSAVVQPPPEGS